MTPVESKPSDDRNIGRAFVCDEPFLCMSLYMIQKPCQQILVFRILKTSFLNPWIENLRIKHINDAMKPQPAKAIQVLLIIASEIQNVYLIHKVH